MQVAYSVEKAPRLQERGGCLNIGFDSSGRAVTSSELQYGWGRDQFYYLSHTKRIPLRLATTPNDIAMIWNLSTLFMDDKVFERFFVGTKAQYVAAKEPDNLPKDSDSWDKIKR